MKKRLIFVIATVLCTVSLTGCDSWKRTVKSVKSDFNGGLDRIVTVYDYNGKVIKSWEGQFNVSESGTEVYFDNNGKRVIIHGGIVINEEK